MGADKLALHGGAPVVGDEGLAPTWPVIDDRDEAALLDVLHGSTWGATGLGPAIAGFNEAWARSCGTARSVALANGTVTMELALRGLGVGPGDEVAVPAWTFVATASAVVQIGATPVFVDIEPEHLCLDPAALDAAISPRTRAVLPVHLGGHPCDMDRICAIGRRHDLVVVEDAAQAHGAMWAGRAVGSLGHAGSFSFQQSKNLQCGEGGSVTTDDEELADRLYFSLSKFGRGTRERYAPFTHYEAAGNACMTEFQAALLLAQLERFDEQSRTRRAARDRLAVCLDRVDGLDVVPVDERVDRHGCHLLLMRYQAEAFTGLPRRRFAEALAAEGVPVFELYPRPLYEEPAFDCGRSCVAGSEQPIVVTDCPESRRASLDVLALPQTALLASPGALDLVPAAVEKVRRHGGRLTA